MCCKLIPDISLFMFNTVYSDSVHLEIYPMCPFHNECVELSIAPEQIDFENMLTPPVINVGSLISACMYNGKNKLIIFLSENK